MEKPIEQLIQKMISCYPHDWAEFYSSHIQIRKLKDEMDQICHHIFHYHDKSDLLSLQEKEELMKKIESKGQQIANLIHSIKLNKSA